MLVSTSIGEEGLDIGEVDMIVCYDAQKTPIRMVCVIQTHVLHLYNLYSVVTCSFNALDARVVNGMVMSTSSSRRSARSPIGTKLRTHTASCRSVLFAVISLSFMATSHDSSLSMRSPKYSRR